MYVSPKQATKHYKVSDQTLRTWANEGRIKHITTKGGHRRYLLEDIETESEPRRIIYARVSSRKQSGDLDRQAEFLKTKYPTYQVITDIGSGINFKRNGFKRILEGVFNGTIKEVVVAQKDRFTRFGYELFEWIFQTHGAVLICDKVKPTESLQQELGDDLMSIITVFSSRYYGRRKYTIKDVL